MNQPAASKFGIGFRFYAQAAVALSLAATIAGVCLTASAEEEQSAKAAASASSADDGVPERINASSKRIQYVGPDTYILLDENGQPQPVPGMTYEDFLAAWKNSQKSGERSRTSRYTIENVEIEGKARESYATLHFVATVRTLVDGEVEVPLGLVGAVLQEEPEFTSPGSNAEAESPMAAAPANPTDAQSRDYLTHDAENGGFVAHLIGTKNKRRNISLRLVVPLLRDGAETSLQLSCPKSLSSNLMLETSEQVAQVSVNNGTLLQQQATQEEATRLRVAGLSGPFRLTWQEAGEGAADFATVLSAAGAVRVSIDGRSIRSDATLTVQSFGRGFDHFRVRLPPGAQFIPERAAEPAAENREYQISLEQSSPNGSDTPADDQPVVLVQFSKEQQAPVTVRLSTEQPIGLEGGRPLELAGFEVLGAVRQYGDIALQVADDWQARWIVGPNVRQVDISDLAAPLQQATPTAAFQYDRQPWSLGVRVAARKSRVHVTPQYELQYLPDEARLTLRLNYQIYGSRVFEFQVRTQGWDRSGPLESGGLVDQDRVYAENGVLVLPLEQASSSRAEITLTMRRSLPSNADRFELPLPVPIATFVGSGDLAVRAASGIELRPDLQNSSGLSSVPAGDATSDARAEGDAIRYRTTSPEPVLVGERLRRGREISTSGLAQVAIGQADVTIDQHLRYDVRYEPLEVLVLQMPDGFGLAPDKFEVSMLPSSARDQAVDGSAGTTLKLVEKTADSGLENGTTTVQAEMPQPQLGEFTVRVRYKIPRPENVSAAAWELPLIRPAEGRVGDWRVSIGAPRSATVALNSKAAGSSWKLTSSSVSREDSLSSYEFASRDAASVLPLMLSPLEFNPNAGTTIERIWLQTWFSGDVRQDRAAIRFRTSASQATVELPPRIAADELEILVDGEPAQIVSQPAGRVNVRIERKTGGEPDGDKDQAPEDKATLHVLELRSRRLIQGNLLTRHQLTPPQLLGTKTISQVYWQIVLPSDQHVVRSPWRLTPASEWQWLGSFWGRQPLLHQAELEEWVGATPQMAPAAAQNQYLFSGLAPVLSIEVITAPRWLVVLVASSLALAIGLAWIYLPVFRRRWVVLALAMVLAGLAVAFPVPAMLLGQASILGVTAAIVSAILARMAARPAPLPVLLSGASSQRHGSSRQESFFIPSVVATASTAPTAPVRASESER